MEEEKGREAAVEAKSKGESGGASVAVTRRAFMKTAVIGTGAVALAACGGGGGSPAAGGGSGPQVVSKNPVTLTFWRHQYAPTDKVYTDIIIPAAKKRLNITINYQVQQDQYYRTQMLPQVATGGGPDIFELGTDSLVKFARSGVVEKLDYASWGGKSKWESFWQKGVLDVLRIDGNDYFVPLEWAGIPSGYFVNQAAAEEAGIAGDIDKYQKTPISWDELGRWAAKMTKRDAQGNVIRDGFAIQSGYGAARTYTYWQPYFLQAGGKFVSGDGKRSLLNSNAGSAAMSNIRDYAFKYGASQLRPTNKESGSAILPEGKTASTISLGIWAYGTFQQLAPTNWKDIRALLAPQVDPSKPKYYTGPGWSHAVNAKSSNKSAAFEFLHFVAEEHGADLFSSGIVTPISGWTTKYKFNEIPDHDVWQKMATQGTPLILSAQTQLTETLRQSEFQVAFEAVMFEKKDLRQEMNTWNTSVQKAVDDL